MTCLNCGYARQMERFPFWLSFPTVCVASCFGSFGGAFLYSCGWHIWEALLVLSVIALVVCVPLDFLMRQFYYFSWNKLCGAIFVIEALLLASLVVVFL